MWVPFPDAPAAGQASVEYIAVISLLAVVLAVGRAGGGAPWRPAARASHKIRLGDLHRRRATCARRTRRERPGWSPCPLSSHTGGYEGEADVFSDDLGARGTLTMTQQSDGTVAAALAVGGRAASAAAGASDVHAGPVQLPGRGERHAPASG